MRELGTDIHHHQFYKKIVVLCKLKMDLYIYGCLYDLGVSTSDIQQLRCLNDLFTIVEYTGTCIIYTAHMHIYGFIVKLEHSEKDANIIFVLVVRKGRWRI